MKKMKKHTILLVLLSQVAALQAQTLSQPGVKELREKSFSKAEKKILKAYAADSSDAMNCYCVALLYGDLQNPRRDNERAYLALWRTKSLLEGLNNLQRGLLKRDGLTIDTVEWQLQATTIGGLDDARKLNTKMAYDHFYEFYARTITDSIRTLANEGVNDLDYADAVRENTIEAYEHFIANHGESAHLFEAEQRMHALAYSRAKSINTLNAYERFLADYPDAEEADEAELRVYAITWYRALSVGTVDAYRKYALDYPDSPYAKVARRKVEALCFSSETNVGDWRSFRCYIENHPKELDRVAQAKRIIAEISIEGSNADGLLWSLQNCDSSMRDTVIRAIHDLYVNSDRIAEFSAQYGHVMPGDLLVKDQEALAAIQAVNIRDQSTLGYAIKLTAPYRISYDILLDMIEIPVKLGRWESAVATVAQFADYFDDDPDYNDLRGIIAAPYVSVSRVPLDKNVNSEKGDERYPVLSADGQTIYFSGNNRVGSLGADDVFVSSKNASGKWRRSYTVPGLNTVGLNEIPQSLSRDGQTIIISQNGRLKLSRLTAEGWSMPESLPAPLRIGSWQGDAMLTSDGRSILFAANSKTEHEVAPSVNIYVSTIDDSGHWSEPISLGPTINSFGSDRAPFLHADMKTLYFCSNRHANIGGFDIFMSTLGKAINTVGDDCWFVVNTAGNTAYIPVKDSMGWDICELELPEAIRPRTVATLIGKVTSTDGKPLCVQLRWIDLQTGALCGIYNTGINDGSFNVSLPLGHEYCYFIVDTGYFPASGTIDLRTTTLPKKDHSTLVSIASERLLRDSSQVELQLGGLFFNSSKAHLAVQSGYEIKRVAKWLQHCNSTVTLTVYTDEQSVGRKNSIDHQRIAAVRDALMKEGCDGAKIFTAVKPYAKGKTLSERQHRQRSLITITVGTEQ